MTTARGVTDLTSAPAFTRFSPCRASRPSGAGIILGAFAAQVNMALGRGGRERDGHRCSPVVDVEHADAARRGQDVLQALPVMRSIQDQANSSRAYQKHVGGSILSDFYIFDGAEVRPINTSTTRHAQRHCWRRNPGDCGRRQRAGAGNGTTSAGSRRSHRWLAPDGRDSKDGGTIGWHRADVLVESNFRTAT